MTNPIIYDGDTHREMTAKEFAEWQALTKEIADRQAAEVAAIEAAAAAKVSARAKLAALGLTEAEVTALLGA